MTDTPSEMIGLTVGIMQLAGFGWRAAAARAGRRNGTTEATPPVMAPFEADMAKIVSQSPPGSVVHCRWGDGSSVTIWSPGSEGARWS